MPSIYQPRRVRQTADWIATAVCHEVPHRQFVFTIPKILRGIFRKRRDLLHLLFKTATETLQETFRTRLNLPDGKLGAIAAVHTFVKIFKAPDFIAAVIDHLPPKDHQTVRYYGLYSNKTRGQQSLIPDRIIRPPVSSDQQSKIDNHQSEILLVPAPPKQSARSMRPFWRDLILKVWGADPLQCPCCKAPMKLASAVKRPEQVEFFLPLHGLWEGIIQLPRPPPPPFENAPQGSVLAFKHPPVFSDYTDWLRLAAFAKAATPVPMLRPPNTARNADRSRMESTQKKNSTGYRFGITNRVSPVTLRRLNRDGPRCV